MASWTSLPRDLLMLVTQQLTTEEMLQARAVCSGWQAILQHAPCELSPLVLDMALLAAFQGAASLDLLSRHASHRLSRDCIHLLADFKQLRALAVSARALPPGCAVHLMDTVRRCKNLTGLILRHVDACSLPALELALASLPRLVQLKLHGVPPPCAALGRCCALQELTVEGVGSAPFSLGDLCCACPRLQRLSISRGKEHVMDSLAPIASLRELTDLVLHVTFREAGFEAISSGCEHLTRLEMSACPTDAVHQLCHLQYLRCLTYPCQYAHNDMSYLQSLTCLERLHFDCTHQGGIHFPVIPVLHRSAANRAALRQLAMPGYWSRSGALALLAQFPALQHLDLSHGSSDHQHEIAHALEGLRQLTHLDLCGRPDLPGAVLAPLGTLRELRYLSLGACGHVEDRHLCGLSLLSHLSHLGLAGCERLTDATLQALARCARLNRLELRGTAVTDTGLATLLPGLTALRLLGLERTGINGSCLEHGASGLRYLLLSHCRVLGPVMLERGVARLTRLRGLDLNGCKQGATDGVLHALARHLTCLDTLDLTGCTQVTLLGLQGLACMTSLVSLRLVCACPGASSADIRRCLAPTGADIVYPQGEHSAAVSPDMRRLKRTQAQRSPLPQQHEGQPGGLRPRQLFSSENVVSKSDRV